MPTVGELIDDAEGRLKASDAVDHPHSGKERYDAEEIMSFVLGHPDELDLDASIPSAAEQRFHALIDRRVAGEPPAYIVGSTEFSGLRIAVAPGAFIPRQSSEWMVDQAVRRLRRRREPVHVDLATGIGPVALAVARRVPNARVIGVDIADVPVRLARANARKLGLHNASFFRGDLFDPIPRDVRGRVDLMTVHPPYVGRRELRELPDEILRYEPREALTDESPLGDRILSRVAMEAPSWLRSGGWLLVEVSPDRSRGVSAVLRRAGFRDVRSTAGGVKVSRVVVGRV